MKTNIKSLPDGKFGKRVGDALYCSYGSCADDADYDVADIYQLLDGTLIAEACGILFPVTETNWSDKQLQWKFCGRKRGHHSRSHNKTRKPKYTAIEPDELPF